MGDFSTVRVTRPPHQAVRWWLTNLEEEDVNQWRAFETEVQTRQPFKACFGIVLAIRRTPGHPDFKGTSLRLANAPADDSALGEKPHFYSYGCNDKL